jgi:CTP synthase
MDSLTPHPVIDIMEEQKTVTQKGGTMRLGAWKCDLLENTKIASVYNSSSIMERHRHRYEFNNAYKTKLESAGMKATGLNPETGLVEVVEIPSHPWFVAVQYHPEYKSTVANPHPLFLAFIKAALKHKTNK